MMANGKVLKPVVDEWMDCGNKVTVETNKNAWFLAHQDGAPLVSNR
jgi:hypothetical protein